MIALSLFFALVVGVLLGVLGGGGSILAVPILVYVANLTPKVAIGSSFAIVGTVSLVGSLSHWKKGNVSLKFISLFGSITMIGAYLGSRLATLISGATQLLLFSGIMLVAAYLMLQDSHPNESISASQQRGLLSWLLLLATGLFVGGLTGLVGVGGGFMIVPALVLLAHLPMSQAVGVSLSVISLNCVVSLLSYLQQVSIPWPFVSVFTLIAVAGIFLGTYLVQFITPRAQKKFFAIFLMVIGTFIIYKNHQALTQLFS